MEVSLHVACHEVGGCHQISRADGLVAEAEVRAGESARLLGVVGEVGLAVLVGVVADNLHRVLVGTDCTVGSKAVEFSLECAGSAESHLLLEGERLEGNVVDDTEREVVLRLWKSKILEHRDNLCGSGVLGGKAVATANDYRSVLNAVEAVDYVEVQRFALCTGFFGTVENSDFLCGLGHSGEEVLCRERTVEVNAHQTYLLAVGVEVVDSLLSGLGNGTHGDNHTLGILGSVVVEQAVFASGDFGNLVHVLLYDCGHSVVVLVACLAVLEEYVGILGHTACYGSIGIEGAGAELGESLAVYERSEVIIFESLDFLYFVAGTESVEEVDERYAALDCCKMSNTGKIHYFLH